MSEQRPEYDETTPRPTDGRTQPLSPSAGVVHVRAIGPLQWEQGASHPVPVRVVRSVQTGIGIGLGFLLVAVPVSLFVMFILGAVFQGMLMG